MVGAWEGGGGWVEDLGINSHGFHNHFKLLGKCNKSDLKSEQLRISFSPIFLCSMKVAGSCSKQGEIPNDSPEM